MAVLLAVFADLVCPWCCIGHHRLASVLALPHIQQLRVQVRHRPFQLDPGTPVEGRDLRAHLGARFGSRSAVDSAFARVAGVARDDGITIDFSKITRSPSTALAHRLVMLADRRGLAFGRALLGALFTAYFERGEDIGAAAVVEPHARAVLGAAAAAEIGEVLHGGALVAELSAHLAHAQAIGVTGVPLFVADERLAVSGAQSADVLERLLVEAARGG